MSRRAQHKKLTTNEARDENVCRSMTVQKKATESYRKQQGPGRTRTKKEGGYIKVQWTRMTYEKHERVTDFMDAAEIKSQKLGHKRDNDA